MMKKFIFQLVIAIFSVILLVGQEAEPDPFTVPDILKDNVAFWKRIYTEVSLKDGLIHDRDFPLVVYKKITIGNLRGRRRRQLIRNHMNGIRHSLDIINKRPPTRWGEKEKRIAALFRRYGDMSRLKTARSRLRFQQGQRERFKLGIERSGAYLQYIRRVFKEYDIPQRIIYLPHVESSFNINAYSKVGAAGMWQFMRRTARLYMTVNYKIDERRDPFKSTVAAAKLLKSNYRAIKSWPLAITAYNHGLVSMKRAVRLTGTRDIGVIVQKYKNRRFRFASKNFYGCFLAASEIGANPGRYFSDFNYHPSQTYNEVVLKSYIRPAALCKHLGISQKELARLNPSLRTSVFHRRMTIPRGFRLRIPFSMLPETAAVKINAIPGTLKASKSNDFHYYSVRRGDTLYRISRRFGVPSEILLAANDINRKNRIYIGQVLRIPGKTPAAPVVPPKKVTPRELHSSSFPKPPRIEMETAKTPPVSTTFDATLYNLDVTFFPQKGTARIRVAVDETLGHYADWLGVSTGRIRGLNRLRRNSLRYNQKILLPIGPDETTLERFKNKRLEYHMALEEDFYNQYQVVGFNVRKVKYGETLWSICNNSANGSDGNGEIPLWLFKKYNRQIGIENLRKNTKIKLPIIKESEKTL